MWVGLPSIFIHIHIYISLFIFIYIYIYIGYFTKTTDIQPRLFLVVFWLFWVKIKGRPSLDSPSLGLVVAPWWGGGSVYSAALL